jgi:hypothetical protein
MKLYKVTAVKTDKAPDYWPFESVVMVTRAVTNDWAVEIGKETIGLIEIQRAAFGSMRIDEVTEVFNPGGM